MDAPTAPLIQVVQRSMAAGQLSPATARPLRTLLRAASEASRPVIMEMGGGEPPASAVAAIEKVVAEYGHAGRWRICRAAVDAGWLAFDLVDAAPRRGVVLQSLGGTGEDRGLVAHFYEVDPAGLIAVDAIGLVVLKADALQVSLAEDGRHSSLRRPPSARQAVRLAEALSVAVQALRADAGRAMPPEAQLRQSRDL